MTDHPFLAETDWLLEHLDDPTVSVVDGSWYLPNLKRDGRAEFEQGHILGAVFFDIDAITEPDSSLPHTLASPEIFAHAVGEMGISDQDTIVVYDGLGLFSAPRVWWNFRVMGAKNVMLLNGGFPKWLKEEKPTETDSNPIAPKTFNARFDSNAVVSFDAMQEVVSNGEATIIDARPAGRFSGTDPEPRPGMRSGHMPGALSLPFSELVKDGEYRSPDELRSAFAKAGVDHTSPVVTTCGSGVTAAAIIFALKTIGHYEHALYDGSWAEWGGNYETIVAVDEPETS